MGEIMVNDKRVSAGIFSFPPKLLTPEIGRVSSQAEHLGQGDFKRLFSYLGDSGQKTILTIVEMALISSDIYEDSIDAFLESIESDKYRLPPDCYIKRLSNEELSEKGLNPDKFCNSRSGLYSGLYYNGRTGEYILAFRGTEGTVRLNGKRQPESEKDWDYGNMPNQVGLKSPQYTEAMELAEHLKERLEGGFRITGHSLGGGLAAAAAIIVRKGGTLTFNSAGLHRATLQRYNRARGRKKAPGKWGSRHLIDNYFVIGEIVTSTNWLLKTLFSIFLFPLAIFTMPLAAGGIAHKIKPADWKKTPMQRHQMSELINSFLKERKLLAKMERYYRSR